MNWRQGQIKRGTAIGGAAPMALRRQIVALLGAGRHAEALHACRQLLVFAPELPDVLALAGRLANDLGLPEEAVGFYERAVACKRDFAEAHYNLGNALMRLGRAAAAVDA